MGMTRSAPAPPGISDVAAVTTAPLGSLERTHAMLKAVYNQRSASPVRSTSPLRSTSPVRSAIRSTSPIRSRIVGGIDQSTVWTVTPRKESMATHAQDVYERLQDSQAQLSRLREAQKQALARCAAQCNSLLMAAENASTSMPRVIANSPVATNSPVANSPIANSP